MTSIFDQPPVVLGDEYPLFKRLSLETTSYCNRACTFCPVVKKVRDPRTSMTDKLYHKVIKELYELNWSGFLQLFLLNEPLIDPDLLRKTRFAREALPRVTIYLSTNGDAVDYRLRDVSYSIKKIEEIYKNGTNSINLNIYDNGEEQARRYYHITSELIRLGIASYNEHKYNKVSHSDNWITLTDMRTDRPAFKRTDLFYVKNHEETVHVKAPQIHCARTQRHLVIEYNGRVPLCCAIDVTSPDVPIIGDVNVQSLREVWNSEMMFKYRYYTQDAKRVLPGCDTCTHRMQMAHFVRKVDAPEAVKQRWGRSLEAYQRAGGPSQTNVNVV